MSGMLFKNREIKIIRLLQIQRSITIQSLVHDSYNCIYILSIFRTSFHLKPWFRVTLIKRRLEVQQNCCPINTRRYLRYLDVDSTFFERYGRRMDVKTILNLSLPLIQTFFTFIMSKFPIICMKIIPKQLRLIAGIAMIINRGGSSHKDSNTVES